LAGAFTQPFLRLLLLTGVAVEKLIAPKFAKIESRQNALQTTFSVFLDIFYPLNLAVLDEKGVFQQPQAITLTTRSEMALAPYGGRVSPMEQPSDRQKIVFDNTDSNSSAARFFVSHCIREYSAFPVFRQQ
jgi:hypothetical protein